MSFVNLNGFGVEHAWLSICGLACRITFVTEKPYAHEALSIEWDKNEFRF